MKFKPCRPMNWLAAFCVILFNLTFAIESKASFISTINPTTIEISEVNPSKWSNLPAFSFYPPSATNCDSGVDCKPVSDPIFALSSYQWLLNEEVKLTFRSAHNPPTVMSVELFRLDDRSSETDSTVPSHIPKHVRVGVILDKYPLSSQNQEYTLKFTPPSFLRTGRYLLAISYFTPRTVGFDRIGVPVLTKVSFDRQLSMTSDLTPVTTKNNDQNGLEPEPNIEKLPVQMVQNFINAMESTVAVCSFCSTFRSLRSTCDYIFSKTTFSSAVRLPDPLKIMLPLDESGKRKLEQTSQLIQLSTSKICQLADLEILLQQLEFKYVSLFQSNTVQSSSLLHPISQLKALVPTHKDGNGIQLWAYPNLYHHLASQLVRRFNLLIPRFDSMFRFVHYDKVKAIDLSNDEDPITLAEMKSRLQKLKMLPTTEPFVGQILRIIRFMPTKAGLYIYATNDFMGRIEASLNALQTMTIPPSDLIGLFNNWMTKPWEEKIDIFKRIFEF
ncbi:hypothetical protein BKA69DRAFT_60850 [Paraphysoderma sedebokerense]|nr:hypothetical protein BKA69DRAFT_60850 [Paraphysoderma sedebokerense]